MTSSSSGPSRRRAFGNLDQPLGAMTGIWVRRSISKVVSAISEFTVECSNNPLSKCDFGAERPTWKDAAAEIASWEATGGRFIRPSVSTAAAQEQEPRRSVRQWRQRAVTSSHRLRTPRAAA